MRQRELKAYRVIADVIQSHSGGTPAIGNQSATEQAFLDGVTAGTVTASKAVVVDANKDVSSFRNVTLTGNLNRTSQQFVLPAAGIAKVGATAGWVVAAADDKALVTLPASQTASTLAIPVTIPLKVGWTITAFSVIAQIESAGGAVTLDADLRKQTNAAGDPTDASIGAITQVSVTADTAVASSKTLATPEVVAATETFYVLVTATTAGSTDIALQGITLTVTEV